MPNEAVDFYLSRDSFKQRVLAIPDVRSAALVATIYCCYARVGEVLRGRKYYDKETRQLLHGATPPLNRDQLEFTDTHLLISMKTEKTGQWRKVAVSMECDGWLVDIIKKWLVLCGHELFPYSTFWAEKKFEKWFGTQKIHLLRHWATTHTLQGHRTKERLSPDEVAKLGGWTDLNTFYRVYSHFLVEDFLHKI